MQGSVPLPFMLPLAQMNTSTGGNGGASSGPASPAVERPTAPAVTVSSGSTSVTTMTASGGSATSTAPGGNISSDKTPSQSPWGMIVPILLMFGVLYFVLFRGQRKEEKRRKSLISELKKGDRVMTIGGMLARVVSIDGDEVVLKVDESANVKATYRKSAIQEVIDREK
jgi:preprotein translocase subunit YajC